MTLKEAPRQAGPHVWNAETLTSDPAAWTIELTSAQTTGLERAATAAGRVSLAELHRIDLDLGEASSVVVAIEHALLHGRGFALVRGLPSEKYSVTELGLIFAALGSQLGSLRPQNASGDRIGHVLDVGADLKSPTTRIYQTNERQTFHTDSCDAVGLLCVRKSMSGGASMLVSAAALYNEMLDSSPELAARMFEPVGTDRRGEVPDGQEPWFEIPVLNWHDEQLTVLYQRQYIDSATRFDDAPRPDAQHVEALDRFDELANDPGFHVLMDFEPGDMQFVHNHSLMHDRTGFVDWPDLDKRRHLLRLWIALANDRELPEVFAQRYGSVDVGDRGGIVIG